MMQQNKQDQTDKHPEGIEMGDQGPSYGSSYNESTPGQAEANRRVSLDDQEEGDERESGSADR